MAKEDPKFWQKRKCLATTFIIAGGLSQTITPNADLIGRRSEKRLFILTGRIARCRPAMIDIKNL
jgi:hypothetical protein